MKLKKRESEESEVKIDKDEDVDRGRLIVRAGIVGVVLNIIMAVAKGIIGYLSNSVSIVSDAVNNLTDSFSSVVTIVGYKLGDKAPTRQHPLGYGRLEYISSLIISAVILFGGFEFLKISIKRIIRPQELKFSWLQIFLLSVTVLTKLLLSRYNKKIGNKTDSEALIASGKDAFMDSITTLTTIIAMLVYRFSNLLIDGYVGVFISIMIIYAGISLINDTIHSILGERPEGDLVKDLEDKIEKYEGVIGVHDLMIHSYGPNIQYASADLELPDYMTVEEAQRIMERAHDDIMEEYNIYFTFGIYSVNTYDDEVNYQRLQVKESLEDIPGILDIHAFNLDDENMEVRFDIVVDFSVHDFEKIRNEVIEKLREDYPEYRFHIDVDLDYS